jgi:DnaA-homolog protein
MMEQVPLPLVPESRGGFETYLPGPNAAAVHALVSAIPPQAPIYLWGESGSGKTHLLTALASACEQRGLRVGLFRPSTPLPWVFNPSWCCVILDDVQAYSPDQQHHAFALCVEAQSCGIGWVASGSTPVVDLPLRDDLRTRLGWGQTHALKALDDEETLAALGEEGDRRGFVLTPEVLRFLFNRYSRDLRSLMQVLDRLDTYSLSRGRAVTLPLLRDLIAQESRPPADATETAQTAAMDRSA